MRNGSEPPFAFMRDLLATEPDEPETRLAVDAQTAGSKAAVLDATVNVLAALRQLLQATEDMVRLRRDRLLEVRDDPPVTRRAPEQPRRERVDLTY
jgi:hypothetical protein